MTADAGALRRRARELLPRDVYDYYAGGSGRERTLRANEKAWRRAWLAPRVLRDVCAVDTRVRLLGSGLPTPVCVAPTGFHRLAHPDGELATAAGAARAGALFVLSARSSRRIEDVADVLAAGGGSWWFQVYMLRDRALTAALVQRAAAPGAGALVLTADTPVVGRKRRDGSDALRLGDDFLVNIGPVDDLGAAAQASDVTFADIRWLAETGGLPVIVKGVLRPDDARACAAAGAAGVIVSNHGGRQLDGAMPTALALPPVAAVLHAGEVPPAARRPQSRRSQGLGACAARSMWTAGSARARMCWPPWPSAPTQCSSGGRCSGPSRRAVRTACIACWPPLLMILPAPWRRRVLRA